MDNLAIREDDRAIWEGELADFVPGTIFDAHAHLYDTALIPEADVKAHALFARFPRVRLADLERYTAVLFPGRQVRYPTTFFPTTHSNFEAEEEFMSAEVKGKGTARALMLACPDWNAAEIERRVDRGGFIGFKPYMCLSRSARPAESTVPEMLPEPYWKVAHERGLLILLHLGRHRAMADPINQRDIRRLAERYPRARLQLAHCARCFTPEIAEAGLPTVADLPNVHVDTSAVTETEVFHILLDVWPMERIIFGTDNAPAGLARGRIATFGLGWYHVDEDNTQAFGAPHTPARPTFLAYENLRCLRYAARRKGWGKSEREDFFLKNAMRIYGDLVQER